MKNQETVVIQSGVENSLSQLGGELFMLPGRTASIVDFRLDLGTKTLRFNGSCSSSKDPRGRSLTIVMHFGKVLEINVQCRSIDRPTTLTQVKVMMGLMIFATLIPSRVLIFELSLGKK